MTKHVYIATPAFDGKVNVPYALSLADLYLELSKNNIQVTARVVTSGSLLVAERNRLVEDFYRTGASHILFIDSDLGFPAEAVISMLNTEKEFVAGVYPARNHIKNSKPEFLYRPKLKENNIIVSDEHLVGAEYIPCGFSLMSRSCIEKMRNKFKHLYYEPKVESRKTESAYCLFDTEVWEGEFWGEDYVFCRRAREAGIDIWVDPLIEFDHAGHRGILIDFLKEQSKNT